MDRKFGLRARSPANTPATLCACENSATKKHEEHKRFSLTFVTFCGCLVLQKQPVDQFFEPVDVDGLGDVGVEAGRFCAVTEISFLVCGDRNDGYVFEL